MNISDTIKGVNENNDDTIKGVSEIAMEGIAMEGVKLAMEGVIIVIKITICAAIIRGADAVIKDAFIDHCRYVWGRGHGKLRKAHHTGHKICYLYTHCVHQLPCRFCKCSLGFE